LAVTGVGGAGLRIDGGSTDCGTAHAPSIALATSAAVRQRARCRSNGNIRLSSAPCGRGQYSGAARRSRYGGSARRAARSAHAAIRRVCRAQWRQWSCRSQPPRGTGAQWPRCGPQ
jgi:hypothetical protein